MKKINCSKIGLVLCPVLLIALAGCVGYVDDGPRRERVYVQPQPVQVVVEDEYVYYPGYQVYYNDHRHQYYYREGRDWVARPAPRGVSVDVLFASPSVRLGFHDHPSNHHATVVREYPKHWTPSEKGHGNRDDRDEEHRRR